MSIFIIVDFGFMKSKMHQNGQSIKANLTLKKATKVKGQYIEMIEDLLQNPYMLENNFSDQRSRSYASDKFRNLYKA